MPSRRYQTDALLIRTCRSFPGSHTRNVMHCSLPPHDLFTSKIVLRQNFLRITFTFPVSLSLELCLSLSVSLIHRLAHYVYKFFCLPVLQSPSPLAPPLFSSLVPRAILLSNTEIHRGAKPFHNLHTILTTSFTTCYFRFRHIPRTQAHVRNL